MSDNTKIQAEILQALLNTSNISDEAYEYLKQHLLGGGSGGGGVVENMTLHDEDMRQLYFVSERNFDDIVADFKIGKRILLCFDRWTPEKGDGNTPASIPLYTPIIYYFTNLEWSPEQETLIEYLNCTFPRSTYGTFDTYGGRKDANGKLRFTIYPD